MKHELEKKLHSADYLGEWRDLWWNRDFLALMAQRWELSQVFSMLDIGCGLGHWGQALAPFLPKDCLIHGIDREKKWVEGAQERAKKLNLNQKFIYQVGDAMKIDFPDNSFDLVTCQTVLIHLDNPSEALKEFVRVLKPNGILIAAEPNNIAGSIVRNSLDFNLNNEDIIKFIRFQMICERGKANLGEGHNSIGDLIPGFFAQLGLNEIKVFQSDKTFPTIPPYVDNEQQTVLQLADDWRERKMWIWNKNDTYRYFIAGGGKEDHFESLWHEATEDNDANEAIKNKTLHGAGGGIFYLISGRKSSSSAIK